VNLGSANPVTAHPIIEIRIDALIAMKKNLMILKILTLTL